MAFSSVNPFPITGYIGKSFFCDREYELMTLKKQVENNINTTLISLRRLGKSSLRHISYTEFERIYGKSVTSHFATNSGTQKFRKAFS